VKNIQADYNKATLLIWDHLSTTASDSGNSWRLSGFQPPINSHFGSRVLSFSAGWFMRLRDVSERRPSQVEIQA
jgi:hypothetical protein